MAAYEPPDFFEFEVSPDLHVPSTAPPSNASGMHIPNILSLPAHINEQGYQIPIEHLKTALVAAAVLSFMFLVAKDAHRAFTRRAHWIPCDFLVLSAFSIQMLNMLNTQNRALQTSPQTGHWLVKEQVTSGQQHAGWKDILMIHNSRTILCVFAAYVMPAMADDGLEHAWVRWVALVITVFHHVTSEYYSVIGQPSVNDKSLPASNFQRLWPQANNTRGTRAPYYVYATLISLCFILLILLLACANIAGRSIERIVSKKISLALRGEGEFCDKTEEAPYHTRPHHHSCWRNVMRDVKTVNHSDPLLHHSHGHSCLQTVRGAVLRAGTADDNHHDSCWGAVEEALRTVKSGEDNHHSCWRTIEEAVGRGEKEEEEQHRRHCHYCWGRVEDAVLKAWIIVRAYSVQPVLARSTLTAAAAVIVSIQIVITIVGGLTNMFEKDTKAGSNKEGSNNFKLVAIILQSMFILMAWALINLRWTVAVAYHRKAECDGWRGCLKMEDFWTRHLRELQQVGESSLEEAQSLDREIDQLVSKKKISTVPSILLSAVIWLQWLLVSISKACWLGSLMILHNKFACKLFSSMFAEYILRVFEDYPTYKKILKEVQMLGESPEGLWVANRKSIEEAKRLSTQGNLDGERNCEDLVEFLISKRTAQGVGFSCLEPHCKPRTGLNFLCKKKPQEERDVENQLLTVEGQFPDALTKSWKMTAVSLLGIIVHLSAFITEDKEHSSSSDCLKAYSQAWEIIDFVEEADAEADGVTSEAADNYFQYLLKKVEEPRFFQNNPTCVRAALEELKKEATKPLHLNPSRCEGSDSLDWKAAASGLAVYNLCNSIECNDGTDGNELLKELESCLADVINECLERVQDLLLLNSRKWALERNEGRMGKALYTAGKAKAIMEKLAFNKLAIVSFH